MSVALLAFDGFAHAQEMLVNNEGELRHTASPSPQSARYWSCSEGPNPDAGRRSDAVCKPCKPGHRFGKHQAHTLSEAPAKPSVPRADQSPRPSRSGRPPLRLRIAPARFRLTLVWSSRRLSKSGAASLMRRPDCSRPFEIRWPKR